MKSLSSTGDHAPDFNADSKIQNDRIIKDVCHRQDEREDGTMQRDGATTRTRVVETFDIDGKCSMEVEVGHDEKSQPSTTSSSSSSTPFFQSFPPTSNVFPSFQHQLLPSTSSFGPPTMPFAQLHFDPRHGIVTMMEVVRGGSGSSINGEYTSWFDYDWVVNRPSFHNDKGEAASSASPAGDVPAVISSSSSSSSSDSSMSTLTEGEGYWGDTARTEDTVSISLNDEPFPFILGMAPSNIDFDGDNFPFLSHGTDSNYCKEGRGRTSACPLRPSKCLSCKRALRRIKWKRWYFSGSRQNGCGGRRAEKKRCCGSNRNQKYHPLLGCHQSHRKHDYEKIE